MINASEKLTFHKFESGLTLFSLRFHNYSICILIFIYLPNSMEFALSDSIKKRDH
jgi:hypothetical protein